MNRIKNHIFRVALLLCLALSSSFIVHGEEYNLIQGKEKKEAFKKMRLLYPEWNTVSLSGKLKMKGLPLSPSVKIFMERDKSVIISLSAIFVGEVGRCEITGDSILLVNKMNKVYVKESLEDIKKYYPGDVGDIQELILGQLIFPGQGNVKEIDVDILEFYKQGEETAIVPVEDIKLDGISYGYMVDSQLRPILLIVTPDDDSGINVTVKYEYYNNKYNIVADCQTTDRFYTATLELDNPEFNRGQMASINLTSKYRRVTLEQFLKSF